MVGAAVLGQAAAAAATAASGWRLPCRAPLPRSCGDLSPSDPQREETTIALLN